MVYDPRYRVLTDKVACGTGDSRLPPVIAAMLSHRGIHGPQEIDRFLSPSERDLCDPMLLPDMEKAVARILSAIEKKEKITVYGDYDADGVTAVAVLYRYLAAFNPPLSYYIPDRESQGYGLHAEAVSRLHKSGTRLIITVDTGTTAMEEALFAKSLGVDLVITDHHTCRESLPEALAVVNPSRHDSLYPFAKLSGVGVAFKLVCAIEMAMQKSGDYRAIGKEILMRYGDIVTVGTVADIMPMLGENRYIVKTGLRLMENTRNPGLQALLDAVSEGKERQITARFAGFAIAPKINAAGRMESADTALELFLTNDSERAKELAEKLILLNKQRQNVENDIVNLALAQIYKEELQDEAILVLGDYGWHPGVVGIAASRLMERFGKPAILVSFDDKEGRGSARAPEGFDIMEALQSVSHLLQKYGGHTAAAGITVLKEDFLSLRACLCDYAAHHIPQTEERPLATVDACIEIGDTHPAFCDALAAMAPFGAGNEMPLFLLQNVTLTDIKPLSGGKHTKMIVSKDGLQAQALLFGKGPLTMGYVQGDSVDLVCHVERSSYMGYTTTKLMVQKIFPTLDGDREDKYQRQTLQEILSFESEMTDLPKRAELAVLYRFLAQAERQGQGEYSYRYVYSSLDGMTYPKLFISLLIFKDAGLINLTVNENTFRFSLNAVKEKVDLEETPLYRRLRPQYD